MSYVRGSFPPAEKRIFINRTLNLRGIEAIGFDMDYTLVHYRHEAWEETAYGHLKRRLLDLGYPVENLEFDPELAQLGLVLDLELGNVVKANRFGYVKRASHGTKRLPFNEQKETYAGITVDLEHDKRWYFLHTLFALSEACFFMQMVDLLDEGKLETGISYADVHRIVRRELDVAHMEGTLKAEILAHPERFIDVDPDLTLALMDLRRAGKKVLLITNSGWHYTSNIMRYAFDPYVEDGQTWRDLFDLVVVSARKPNFFSQRGDIFEVVDDSGLLKPNMGTDLVPGGAYLGGNAGRIEKHLGVRGSQILYVGDHIFGDVVASKNLRRWRTMLVLRELEGEIAANVGFADTQRVLDDRMAQKEVLEYEYSVTRLKLLRISEGYGPTDIPGMPNGSSDPAVLKKEMQRIRAELVALDQTIAPLARQSAGLLNPRWGLLMRAGQERSLLAREIEQSADVYTSRPSNLLHVTPFEFLRSSRMAMAHDVQSLGEDVGLRFGGG